MNFKVKSMLDIESVLIEKGISKSELADKLGRNRSYVTNLINKNNPTLETLHSIASALGVDVVDLFKKKSDGNKKPLIIKDDNGNEVVAGYLFTDRV